MNRKTNAAVNGEEKAQPDQTQSQTRQQTETQTYARVPFTYIQPEICTACGICVEVCPLNAIKMENGIAVVMRDICRNCKICVRICPEGAIM